jgi:hypothetical protein
MGCDLDGNAMVQIAAFCHGANFFRDDLEYIRFIEDESKANPNIGAFASESFLPIGMLSDGELPPATARVSGHVLEARRETNVATGLSFWAMLVKTVGMTLDVVADDEQLEGEPAVGGVLAGSCWLSAVPAEGGGSRRLDLEIVA